MCHRSWSQIERKKKVIMIWKRCCITKYSNLLSHREKWYKNRLGTQDGRPLQIRATDNLASLLESTGKHVAARTMVICFLEFITEIKDCHTEKIKDRLRRESGGARPKIHPRKQVRQRARWQSTDPWWQASSCDQQCFFIPKLQCVSLEGKGDFFVTDGEYKHHTCAHSALPHT